MIATALSDAELLEQAREGDEAAFTELYVRHQAAALRLASSYRRAGDPEDLVNSSFERVLGALRRGAGPTDSFRAYLFVTLRRLASENLARSRDDPYDDVPEPVQAEAHGPEADRAERALVMQAYESLPDRWQAVLWQTTVEGRAPRELAPVLGMSANAAAALAYRAREKLRQAYLQAHLQAAPRPQCEPHRSRLGAYVRDGLSRRDRTSAEGHLDDCTNCRELVAELVDINAVLNRSVLPLFLASSAKAGAVAGGAAGGGLVAGPLNWFRRGWSKARNNPTGAAAVAAGLAVAIAAGLIASTGSNDEAPPPDAAAGPEEEVDPPASGGTPDETPDPEPEPDAGDEQDPPDQPPPDPTSAPDGPEPSSSTEPESPATTPAPERPRSMGSPQEPPATEAPRTSPPATSAPGTTTAPTTTAPPATTTTTAPAAPPAPPMGPVVWNPGAGTVDITLTNSSNRTTGYMLMNVSLSGGAVLSSSPSGCNLAVSLIVTAECGVNPIPPGGSRMVQAPVQVTGSGQRATVSQCTVGLLRLACDSPILRTTTVDLE